LWWALWRRAGSRDRPDLVHVHGGSELVGLLAMVVLWLRRAPFVVQPHGMYTYPRGSVRERVARSVFMPFVRRGRVVIALTDSERELLIGYGVRPEVVQVVPNGIHPETVPQHSPENGVPTVAFVGRLQQRKHPERFTAAAALLTQRGVKARFVTAGADQGALGIARAADPEGVVEHLGALAPDDARRVIAATQIVVVCSDTEPFGIVAIEALASGTALLITDSCDLAGELGAAGAALVTSPEPSAIADGIAELLGDAELRAAQAAAGAALVRERYSMDVVTPQWARLYGHACEKPAQGAS
jgi:glycosyltransferase involved in cell wall biosynthesis